MSPEKSISPKPEDKSTKIQVEESIQKIEGIAKNFGLDFFPIIFHIVSPERIYELAAYGMPGRFSHWTFGQEFNKGKMGYDYGLGKIYELVINTNPSHGFMMDNNTLVEDKLVIGHVMAHVDFFKNNPAFKDSNRNMIENTTAFSRDLERYRDEFGDEEIDKTIESAMSVEYYFSPEKKTKEVEKKKNKVKRAGTQFDDLFELAGIKTTLKENHDEKKGRLEIPHEEEIDIMKFIAENSPSIEDWQKDIVLRMRDEMVYFYPQMKTKIMNEGWASFWHKRIMRELVKIGDITEGENIHWIIANSGVLVPSPKQINPYYVGCMIFEDIDRKFRGEERKDGKIEKDIWGDKINPSIYKGDPYYDVFKVRANSISDQEFLRNYLTAPLIDELILPYFKFDNEKIQEMGMDSIREYAKQYFINMYDNLGMPKLVIPKGGGNYNNNSELCLEHIWDGRDIDQEWAKRTLKNIYKLWQKPIHLLSRDNTQKIEIVCKSNVSETDLIFETRNTDLPKDQRVG